MLQIGSQGELMTQTLCYVECVQSSGRLSVLFLSQATGGARMRGELDVAPSEALEV